MIVPLEPSHIPKILAAQRELYSMNFRKNTFDREFFEIILSWYEEVLVNQEWQAFVLQEEGKLAGFYLAQYSDASGYLSQMFISGEYRGKGFGKLLLDHFEQGIALPGYYVLQASAINEAAVAFYKRNGYDIMRTEYDDSGDPRYLMIKRTISMP